MKKFQKLAIVIVFLLCICGFIENCNNNSETDSVTSIRLKYNNNEITDDSFTVNLEDGTITFTADVQVTGKASKNFTLTSSDLDIATVSDKTVTLLAEGQTTITATAEDDSTKTHAITLIVTAQDSVKSIKLKYKDNEIDDSLTVNLSDGPLTFTADVQITGGASKDFTLKSSNTRIATVAADKRVFLVAKGQTTITATAVGDSTKTHAITLNVSVEYKISITGGTADMTTALLDQTVTLTQEIPPGKIFIGWTITPASVQMLSDNSFKMPSANVTVTGNYGDNKPYYITNNFAEDSSTGFLVQWHHFTDSTQTLQYVNEDGNFENATTINVVGVPFQTLGVVGNFGSRKIFRANLTGLTPNTRYKYRMGSPGAWSDEYHLLTSSGNADDFSFTVVSDPQSEEHTDMVNVLNAADAFDTDNKFYLMGGDLVDAIGGRPNEIISYTNAANGFNNKKPIIATQGNHDTYFIDGSSYRFGEAEVFNAFITFPDNGGDTQANKAKLSQSYYFYYNKVLIIMLNTMATSTGTGGNPDYTRQANWLKEVLEKDRQNHLSRYTIVFTHIGPLGGIENSRWLTPESRAAFGKIYTDYNVDIVFSGHDHVYARSNTIKIGGDYSLTAMESAGNFNPISGGTVFSIASATGPKFYAISKTDTWIPKYFPARTDEQSPGVFINVKVTASKLIVTAKKVGTPAPLDTYEVSAK
ncbi:hypothetical protein R84B8_03188 [Treponema sp. R8-4-B8]